MTPGKLIPVSRQDQLDLARIEAMIAAPDFAALASGSRDARMSVKGWKDALAIELLSLLAWAARRRIAAARMPDASERAFPDGALVLLPRYGFAIHVLRRAVPLAACGIRTSISVPPECMSQARSEARGIVSALGLAAHADFEVADPVSLVAQAARQRQPILLTGRFETYERIRSEHPQAHLFGATGRCAVLVTSQRTATGDLEAALRRTRLEQSCSNLAQVVECKWSGGTPQVERTWPRVEGATGRPLDDVLRSLHPSVVYCSDDDPLLSADAESLAGYALIRCEHTGSPLRRLGFAADPIAGWPGDYLL